MKNCTIVSCHVSGAFRQVEGGNMIVGRLWHCVPIPSAIVSELLTMSLASMGPVGYPLDAMFMGGRQFMAVGIRVTLAHGDSNCICGRASLVEVGLPEVFVGRPNSWHGWTSLVVCAYFSCAMVLCMDTLLVDCQGAHYGVGRSRRRAWPVCSLFAGQLWHVF